MMGEVINFPNKAMTIGVVIDELARGIAAENGAKGEDALFLKAEAKELRDRYFKPSRYELSLELPISKNLEEDIRKAINNAMNKLISDIEKDKVRMTAEILTLKHMLRTQTP